MNWMQVTVCLSTAGKRTAILLPTISGRSSGATSMRHLSQLYMKSTKSEAADLCSIQTTQTHLVVLLTMIAFYATSFDSIALTASCYSYHTLEDDEQPNKGIQLMWCILLILLPIALLFAESSMNNLQSVSIVAAFPIGAVIVMIAISFMKDAKKYMKNLEKSAKQKGEK